MLFSREGEAAAVATALARVLAPDSFKVALLHDGEARSVCVLTAGPARGATLDESLRPEQCPWLAGSGFTSPAADAGKSMSLIRSTVKSAIGYNAEKGDRIIILTCPPQEWDSLRLTWPVAERKSP